MPASPSTSTVTIDAPPQDWQPCLGQRVRVTAPLTISGNRNLRKRGELVVSFDGRRYTPTEVARPGADAARATRTPAELDRQLGKRIAGAAEWHNNADAADNVGYRDAIDQQQATGPWPSFDHDPRLVGLRLRTP